MPHKDGLLNEALVDVCFEKRSKNNNEKTHYGRKAQPKIASTVVDESALNEAQSDDVAADEDNNDAIEVASCKSSKRKQERERKFSLVSYIEPDKIKQLLVRSEWVQHWSYCTHDKDVLSDGSPKGSHTHIVLYTYNAKSSSAIRKIFDRYALEICEKDEEPQNTLCQVCSDMVSAYRYLIHADDKNKAQYEIVERVCDDFGYWHDLEASCGYSDVIENKGKSMIDDMLDGVSTYEMVKRYGKEYIYHSQQLRDVASRIQSESFYNSPFESFRDFCGFVLDVAPFSDEDKVIFFNLLTYCQSMVKSNNADFGTRILK